MERQTNETNKPIGVLGAVAAVVVASAPRHLAAQEAATQAAAETTIPGGSLVVASYIVLWVGLLAFVGYLGWRQRRLYEELDGLEERLDAVFDDEFEDETRET